MYRISTIDKSIPWMGMNHINILVADITGNIFHVSYEKGSGKFYSRETGKLVEEPVMWDYLPKLDHVLADEEYNVLYG